MPAWKLEDYYRLADDPSYEYKNPQDMKGKVETIDAETYNERLTSGKGTVSYYQNWSYMIFSLVVFGVQNFVFTVFIIIFFVQNPNTTLRKISEIVKV